MTKFSSMEKEQLIKAGDYLELNKYFHALDHQRWKLYRGHSQMMARLLAKYEDIIFEVFGNEISDILKKCPNFYQITFTYVNSAYGPQCYLKTPDLTKDLFYKYKNTVKTLGLWFDGENRQWFISSKIMNEINISFLYEKLYDLNFEIKEKSLLNEV